MANYSQAVLAKGQAWVSAKNQAPEQRRKMPTVFELALKNQDVSIPNAAALRTSPLRPVDINYYTDITPGAGTTKAALHTGTYGDNAKVNLVYVSHVEVFSLPRKMGANSIDTYQQRFNNLYEMKWKNLRTRHDDSALAYLIAQRSQLSKALMDPQIASAGAGNWNEVTYALEVANVDKKLFIQRVKSFMMARKYPGTLDIISDLQVAALVEFFRAQGPSNETNLGFQYSGTNIATTQDQISADYPNGALLALPQGLFAGLNWNERLNREGVDGGRTDSIGILGTIADPFGSGAVADISMYTKRSDTSADTSNGSTQDVVDEYELTLTIAYALPPLSTANDSVVHLFGQAA